MTRIVRVTEVRETIKHDTTRYTDKKLVSDVGETVKRDTTWLVVYCYIKPVSEEGETIKHDTTRYLK